MCQVFLAFCVVCCGGSGGHSLKLNMDLSSVDGFDMSD